MFGNILHVRVKPTFLVPTSGESTYFFFCA